MIHNDLLDENNEWWQLKVLSGYLMRLFNNRFSHFITFDAPFFVMSGNLLTLVLLKDIC